MPYRTLPASWAASLLVLLLSTGLAAQTPAYLAPPAGVSTKHPQDIDVRHYRLQLRIPQPSKAYLEGEALLKIQVLQDSLDTLSLDFAGYTITRALLKGHPSRWVRDTAAQKLYLIPERPLPAGLVVAQVRYQGEPVPVGRFGGVYVSDSGMFNMGVSLTEVPHSYGRVWFPCRDVFQDKATYQISLETPPGWTGVAAGALLSREKLPDYTRYNWSLRHPIPAYLASFAVGRYAELRDTFEALLGSTPVSLFVSPNKRSSARATFAELEQVFHAFEQWFGPYRWERLGYVAVDFPAGAMEHATNVAYPHKYTSDIPGSARLWAHELAHSWFGNLVTCDGAEEMWLNEGLARYAEVLYYRAAKGRKAAQRYLDQLHYRVLRFTPIADGKRRPLTPMPRTHTYGSTIYDQGGVVTANLHTLLGDSLFFAGLRRYLDRHAWGNAATPNMRAALEEVSGRHLAPLFANWVYGADLPVWAATLGEAQPPNSEEAAYRTPLKLERWDTRPDSLPSYTQPLTVVVANDQRAQHDTIFLETTPGGLDTVLRGPVPWQRAWVANGGLRQGAVEYRFALMPGDTQQAPTLHGMLLGNPQGPVRGLIRCLFTKPPLDTSLQVLPFVWEINTMPDVAELPTLLLQPEQLPGLRGEVWLWKRTSRYVWQQVRKISPNAQGHYPLVFDESGFYALEIVH